jgi:hypothetical protein
MNLIGEINAGIESVAQSMKDSIKNSKLDGMIVAEERKIKNLTIEIGNLAVHRLDMSEHMTPDIMERYARITAARQAIKSAEAKKSPGKPECPKCGAKSGADLLYCGVCGELLGEKKIMAV